MRNTRSIDRPERWEALHKISRLARKSIDVPLLRQILIVPEHQRDDAGRGTEPVEFGPEPLPCAVRGERAEPFVDAAHVRH